MIKLFKCDRQSAHLEELTKKKSSGIIIFNNKISNLTSAYLINQSVTGLYEVKVDLLKG